MGGCDWVSSDGGPVEVKKTKTEPPGLGFGKQNVEGFFLCRGDLVGVGYTAFEAVGGVPLGEA